MCGTLWLMHVRLTMCLGTPILEEGDDTFVGTLDAPVLEPDTGVIEGFFVRIPSFLRTEMLFLASTDIVHWGTVIRIVDSSVLGPLSDRIRLYDLYTSGRTIVGQRIVTESKKYLGRCTDIQFDTRFLRLEWIFPRKFFWWGIALPVTEIVSITPEAIIVKDAVIVPKKRVRRELNRALLSGNAESAPA